jgi:hypothetical protein
MAEKTIADYSAAISIDAANDYLLIEPSGDTVYKKINRNTLLGLASAPLGTTDSQSPTNKTFNNTNTFTIKDGSLTLQNTSSTTKQAVFSLASITAGQTRTITVPDASLTLVGTATTQTLTNKTLTSPTITGGTIDNTTITVDSIAGHTSATIVTIANLQISAGVLNSANAVTATSIAAGAVQPLALVTGTGSGWAWSSWSPTWTNLTVGNGTVTARYIQIGKNVFFSLALVLGGTSAVTGSVTFTLPVTSVAPLNAGIPLGNAIFHDATGSDTMGLIDHASTTTAAPKYAAVSGSLVIRGSLSGSAPFSWTTSDSILCEGFYEAA